jgi:hypothetical protein
MSDELADYEPSFAAFAIVGAVVGAVLGWLVGGAEGELGRFPSGWQVGLYPLLPVLLAAVCYKLYGAVGIVKSVFLAPVVAIEQTFLAIAWLAGYFLVPLPAVGVFALVYYLLGWPLWVAGLALLLALAVWMLLLRRLPIAPLIDAFYDSGAKAVGLLAGALFAVAPAMVVGALLGYYLGYLDDLSWEGGGRDSMVGAILGGVYGLSVGLLVPITTMFAMVLGEAG